MLKLNNIDVIYLNSILVLKGVSLNVEEGKIVSLLGANGAGKSTTLKSISGLIKVEEGEVSAGSIEFEGKRIDNEWPENIVKAGVIHVIEGRMIFQHLTAEENIMIGGHLRRDKAKLKQDLEHVYSYFPGLSRLRNRIIGYLSGGEQQMVVIGRALMARPRLMMLDEPSLGLAPRMMEEIFGIIDRINKNEGSTILLVEQNVEMALSVADYGYVMENGKIVMDGPAEKLRKNEDIKEFYLGLSQLGEKKSYRSIKHYRRRKRWLG
ncbi:MAG: ABC transporter ATP-binding protein [Desulfobacteraceae bacterium]|nr:MAG: ABC transporter ATP-binding protein [Desulfobacteraceae bacterium]